MSRALLAEVILDGAAPSERTRPGIADMFQLGIFQIWFTGNLGNGVKADLTDGLEGAVVIATVQKLTISWGTHGKLQHVVT